MTLFKTLKDVYFFILYTLVTLEEYTKYLRIYFEVRFLFKYIFVCIPKKKKNNYINKNLMKK